MCSCIESIELDLPSTSQRLVVFGWVTNQKEAYTIQVSLSNGFNSTEPYEVVSGATVYVYDRLDNRFDFVEGDVLGSYVSDTSLFTGIANESYELHIETLEGNHIVSTREVLKPLPPIVSSFVSFFLNPEEVDVPEDEPNYYVGGLIDDIPDIDNYYRWKIYVNGILKNTANDLVLFDDKFTDGNIFRFDASNVLFMETDRITLESMSLSSGASKYYKQLKTLSGSDLTGPAFEFFPLKGNLTDIAMEEEVLGYFGASAIEVIDVQ